MTRRIAVWGPPVGEASAAAGSASSWTRAAPSLVVLFLMLQRFWKSGMTAGAVK
ncbi:MULTISPECIES: hypothetical protein [unclassified Streptomyces]|uniref:hypothetical protein n=1 Tax=Streptomyces sp. NPDC127532 TaxID=3345399 RepID=UPI00362A1F8E